MVVSKLRVLDGDDALHAGHGPSGILRRELRGADGVLQGVMVLLAQRIAEEVGLLVVAQRLGRIAQPLEQAAAKLFQ